VAPREVVRGEWAGSGWLSGHCPTTKVHTQGEETTPGRLPPVRANTLKELDHKAGSLNVARAQWRSRIALMAADLTPRDRSMSDSPSTSSSSGSLRPRAASRDTVETSTPSLRAQPALEFSCRGGG
jgi:hypothetical protein